MKALMSTICFLASIAAHANIDSHSIVGIWLFDEGKGWKTYNQVGKHSWIFGDRRWVDGKFGKSLNFTKSSLSDIHRLSDQIPTKDITVTAWTKILGGRNARLFDAVPFPVQDFNEDRTIGALLPWDGGVRWRFGSPFIELVAEFDRQVKDVWRHWAFVHSRRDNLMAIYLDGELLASMKKTTTYIRQIKRTRLSIGGWPRFPGLIDEFAIFRRRLTQEEIRSVMTRGLATALAVAPTHSTVTTSWASIKKRQ